MTTLSSSSIDSDSVDEALWLEVGRCPACQGAAIDLGRLFSQLFQFGGVRAPVPPQEVRLARCAACGLVFKTLVASPALLERMTAARSGRLWVNRYNYADEIALVSKHDVSALMEVIDIGAAGGGFLSVLPAHARKSALDIVRFPSLQVTGEFVKGFVDHGDLDWSHNPYRLVGMFDVAEHLYDPRQAFENLRRLCRDGGLVLIETGDSDTVRSDRLTSWYYLNLLEHHIAWNRRSIEALLTRSGFEVLSFRTKRHKNASVIRWKHRAKLAAFQAAPRLMQALYRSIGKILDVPAEANLTDHMQVVARAR